MIFPQNAFKLALILVQVGVNAVHSKEINGQASPGNYILREKYSSDIDSYALIDIDSNLPITIQRYYDDEFVYGSQPFRNNEVKVLITSDCAATTPIHVDIKSNSININAQGVSDSAGSMPFLESSSYEAAWSYDSYWCEVNKSRNYPPTPTPPSPESTRIKGSGGAYSLKSSIRTLFQNIMGAAKTGKSDEASKRSLSSNACNVNVEVMLDGCSHNIAVSAPAVRVLEASLENIEAWATGTNPCVTNYEADIMFTEPYSSEGEQLLSVPNLSLYLPSMEEEGYYCSRAVPGRPFVDSTGNVLQALPLIAAAPVVVVGEATNKEWTAEAEDSTAQLVVNNTTANQNQLILGEEWTKSALGEHASVASFSAFSIALMTNQAPSDLVEDALKAALDEVRHAKKSFDIASRLTGKEIGPGPLPKNEHVFSHDLKALALAVAKEGCVDETLSALEAAAEVDLINTVLANEAHGTKYAGVDRDILVWMRDELRIIALEESDHAALAWRTFKWVCGVDFDACNFVKQHILNKDELDNAFQRRFGSLFAGRSEKLETMEVSWREIYSQKDIAAQVCVDSSGMDVDIDNANDESLITIMARKVVDGVLCR